MLELVSAQRDTDEQRPLILAGGDLAHIGRRPWPTSYLGVDHQQQPAIGTALLERTPKVVLDVEHRRGHKYYVLRRLTTPPSEELCFESDDVKVALFAFACAIEQSVGLNFVNAAAWVEHRKAQPGLAQVLLVIPRNDASACLQQDDGPWNGYGKKAVTVTAAPEQGLDPGRLEAALHLVERAYKHTPRASRSLPVPAPSTEPEVSDAPLAPLAPAE